MNTRVEVTTDEDDTDYWPDSFVSYGTDGELVIYDKNEIVITTYVEDEWFSVLIEKVS